MKLYNTLTGKKEDFKPINDKMVGIYNCGPTVYNYAHIGNLRAYVFADVLRRTLEWSGYKVKQVMNITDIGQLTSDADEGEDKMVKALKREALPLTLKAMNEVGEKYKGAFIEDLKTLNIEMPDKMPKASEHVAEDIEIIKKLEEKGFAYKISDGIYFDTAKFPNYGKLGGVNKAKLKEGARVTSNPEKKNPADFNLWKLSTSANLGFDSPWGTGFPGWHIECSAMSRKYLGQPFDIHTGGVDHIGTHHNNEIAQSEAAFDAPLANYWMHNEHLNISGGEKMAKSGEGFITLQTIVKKKINPLAYRYYLLGANYRTPMIFSFEALSGAETALNRLVNILKTMPEGGKVIENNENGFGTKKIGDLLDDDLDTPSAIAFLWDFIKDENISPSDRRATILKFDETLGLNLIELIKKELAPVGIPHAVKKLLSERESARASKNWNDADKLRDEIKSLGFEVKDTDNGQVITEI